MKLFTSETTALRTERSSGPVQTGNDEWCGGMIDLWCAVSCGVYVHGGAWTNKAGAITGKARAVGSRRDFIKHMPMERWIAKLGCGCEAQSQARSNAAIREGGSRLPFSARKRSRRYERLKRFAASSPPCPSCRPSPLCPSRSSSPSPPTSPPVAPSLPFSLSSSPASVSPPHSASARTHTSSPLSSRIVSMSPHSSVVSAQTPPARLRSPSSSSSAPRPSASSGQGTFTTPTFSPHSGRHSPCSWKRIPKTDAPSTTLASPTSSIASCAPAYTITTSTGGLQKTLSTRSLSGCIGSPFHKVRHRSPFV